MIKQATEKIENSKIKSGPPPGPAFPLDAGEWKETTLGDVAEKIIDYRGKTPKKLGSDWSPNGKYRALSAKSVKTGGLINEDQISLVDEDLYNKWMKDEVLFNDILLTSEAPMGEVLIWKSDEKIVLSQRLFAIRSKKEVSPDYLYQFFKSSFFQWELLARSSGTTVVGIRQAELIKTKIILPPLPEQKAIAAALSSFDDKIELLREQNKTLEATAQAIFKEWFVNFEFPVALCHSREGGNPDWTPNQVGDDRKGYKSSGGKMIDSELGPIPVGWHVGIYEDLTNVITGKGLPKDKIKSKGLYEILGANGSIGKTDDYLFNEDLIITGRVGTLGNVYISKGKAWISDNVLISTPKKWFYFTFFTLKRFNFEALNRGSTQPLITQTDLKNVQIIIPDFHELDLFELTIKPIFNKIFSNYIQIQTLSKIRDTLLPKLMTSQIRVKGFY